MGKKRFKICFGVLCTLQPVLIGPCQAFNTSPMSPEARVNRFRWRWQVRWTTAGTPSVRIFMSRISCPYGSYAEILRIMPPVLIK